MTEKSTTGNILEVILPLAFQFREAELWEELTDSDIYAVRLSNKTIAYCCVMGSAGEHYSLGIYFGAEGFRTYLDTIHMNTMGLDRKEMFETVTTFGCVNMDYTAAGQMEPQIKKEIAAWAKAHGQRIHRNNGYPDPTRFYPGKAPWRVTDAKDGKRVCEVLRASIDLREKLKDSNAFYDLGFDEYGTYPDVKGGKRVPLIEPMGNGFFYSATKLPKRVPIKFPAPEFDKDLTVMSLKAMRKSGELYCRVVHFPSPVQNDKAERPYYPCLILTILKETEIILQTGCVKDIYPHAEELVLKFAEAIKKRKTLPCTINVEDDLSFSILQNFCKCLDIKLNKMSNIPSLNDAWNFMFMQLSNSHQF